MFEHTNNDQSINQKVVNLEEEEEEQPQSQRRSLCNRSKIVARLCWQHFRADWRTNLGYLIFTGLVFAWMIHEGSPFIVMLMGLVIFFCLSSCIRLCLLAHDEEEGARFRMQLQQNPQPLMMINPLHLRLALVDRDFTPNGKALSASFRADPSSCLNLPSFAFRLRRPSATGRWQSWG